MFIDAVFRYNILPSGSATTMLAARAAAVLETVLFGSSYRQRCSQYPNERIGQPKNVLRTYHGYQITYRKCSHGRLLVVILDVDVDHMHR